MKFFLIHPTGNNFVRALLSKFSEEELLAEFGTTLATDSLSNWIGLLPPSMRNEWLRRSFQVSSDHLWTHPLREICRMFLPKIGLQYFSRHERGFASIDAVYRDFDYAASKHLIKLASYQEIDAVYAYEDGALSTFKAAKKLGIKCVYDLPIVYWETGRKLILEEAERLPKWANTLLVGGGINNSAEKLERKVYEIELADMIVCPGQFVADSLPNWIDKKKIVISPFGSPHISLNEHTKNYSEKPRPLRVLFVGSMTQRKGLGDLFAAIRLINSNDIELVVMGELKDSLKFYKKELPNFTYEPGRPHFQVLELMRSCDVFCLPSIVEGRALVMQEAMSQGLPIIITTNTGGADLVIDRQTGFLIPIRSPEAIASKLTWFLENREVIPEMGQMAKKHAAKYTWDFYGNKIVESIKACINN